MNNLMYLRRRLMRARDLTNPAMVPYLMNPTEQGMNPDQLQRYVMDSLVPHAEKLTAGPVERGEVFNGEKLYKTGFWNLLYRVLTSEAYQFMDDAGGLLHQRRQLELGALAAGLRVRPEACKYRTLVAGYEALPRAVGQAFVDIEGDFHPNCRLDIAGPARRRLRAALRAHRDRRARRTNARTIPGPKETLKVSAQQVVLAMPRRSLELVRWEPFIQEPAVRELVNAVISQAAFKIFLGYPYPWWRVLGLQAGRSITDMPLRQTFYFQTEGEQKGADPANDNSLMMVSYNDLGSVPFWKALEARDARAGARSSAAGPTRSSRQAASAGDAVRDHRADGRRRRRTWCARSTASSSSPSRTPPPTTTGRKIPTAPAGTPGRRGRASGSSCRRSASRCRTRTSSSAARPTRSTRGGSRARCRPPS